MVSSPPAQPIARTPRRPSWVWAWLLWVAVGPGCARPSGKTTVLVFAAASLAQVFQELSTAFQRAHPELEVQLHVAGTPRLVLQIREGAAADVFASADRVQMQRVVAAGAVVGDPATFARNRLAIVTPIGNPAGIHGLADLPRHRVLLCGPEVPAGRYARAALESAGVAVRSLSDAPSVQAVLSKVALGEVDGGIVYATDARAAAGRTEAVAIDEAHQVDVEYPIACLRAVGARPSSPATPGARFVAFVRSAAGQGVLRRYGFLAP